MLPVPLASFRLSNVAGLTLAAVALSGGGSL
jgi:hypothetical protein